MEFFLGLRALRKAKIAWLYSNGDQQRKLLTQVSIDRLKANDGGGEVALGSDT